MQRPRAVYASTCGVSAGKSVGRWRLALRVHRVRQPAKSKVAEFVCKFKCLPPRATLNSDLHADPLCCRMRERTTEGNNFRCGCGRIDFVFLFFFLMLAFSRLLTDVMISRSRAAEQSTKFLFYSSKVALENPLFFLLFFFKSQTFLMRNHCIVIWGQRWRAAHQPLLPNQSPVVLLILARTCKHNTVTLWTFQNLS